MESDDNVKKTMLCVLVLLFLLSGCSRNKSLSAENLASEASAETDLSSGSPTSELSHTTIPLEQDEEDDKNAIYCLQNIDEHSKVYLSSEDKDDYYADFNIVVETENNTYSTYIGLYEKRFLSTSTITTDDFNQDNCPDFLVWCLVSPNGGTVCQMYTFKSDTLELLCDLNDMDIDLTWTFQDNYVLMVENADKTANITVNVAEQIDPEVNPTYYDENGKVIKEQFVFYRPIDICTVQYSEEGETQICCTRIAQYGVIMYLNYTLAYDLETDSFDVVQLTTIE